VSALFEYGPIAALIAVVAIGAIRLTGTLVGAALFGARRLADLHLALNRNAGSVCIKLQPADRVRAE
jgi:hypothetical protein